MQALSFKGRTTCHHRSSGGDRRGLSKRVPGIVPGPAGHYSTNPGDVGGSDLMTGHASRVVLGEIAALFREGTASGLSDAQLLAWIATRRDGAAAAFEALVRRHGPMVLSTCR